MRKYLIFVDTNILLDFYRVRHESSLELLQAFDGLHDRLITSYQVEMEFKNNRQSAIAESLRNLKGRDKLQPAAFLAESRSAESENKTIGGVNRRIDKLRARLRKVMAEPTRHDPVYKVAQRLFTNGSALNLDRSKRERHALKRLAFRRFILGYPPRKSGDTSMGDALNWEWLIRVAQETGDDIIVVSRDADFGLELDGEAYLNDWLGQEFRDRVSKKRLFNRLTPALKLANVSIKKEVEKEEEEDLARSRKPEAGQLWPDVGSRAWIGKMETLIREGSSGAGNPESEG